MAGSGSADGWDVLGPFSRELRRVTDYQQLITVVRDEVARRLGMTNAWLYV